MKAIAFLGVAQLFVFAASIVSEQLLKSAVGAGTLSEQISNISKNHRRIRISNLVALANTVGIIVLAALFYIVLSDLNKSIALVALGLFWAEAITLAMSKIGSYALIPLSRDFVDAGSPAKSHYQMSAEILYYGLDRKGYDVHMLFFCLGAILWYYLLYISEIVPNALSIWGLAAVCMLSVPVFLTLYNRDLIPAAELLALPYAPFEVVLGIWLIVSTIN
jgi:hypothetical protein